MSRKDCAQQYQTIVPSHKKTGERHMKVEGQSALITGGGSGMGAATARLLARLGARVAVIDLNSATVEAVAAEIGGIGLVGDVTDSEGMAAVLAQADAAQGPARIIVHCAGVAPAARILGKEGPMTLEAFRKVIDINLVGTFNLLRLGAAAMTRLPPLEGGERGVIINTTSIAAYEGQIGQAAYAASKGGVVALTLPAARELARHGIRVMAIAPGLIATPMLLGFPQEVQDSLASQVPYPSRFGTPEEFAALAHHIIGNQMLNGSVIRLDGALRMSAK
jgi:NAD(P)-dependent dehydrogenase (short-subunit alcohol dehydrogenase family)